MNGKCIETHPPTSAIYKFVNISFEFDFELNNHNSRGLALSNIVYGMQIVHWIRSLLELHHGDESCQQH